MYAQNTDSHWRDIREIYSGIKCLQCDQQKLQAGSVKFHAHRICEECAAKLKSKEGGK